MDDAERFRAIRDDAVELVAEVAYLTSAARRIDNALGRPQPRAAAPAAPHLAASVRLAAWREQLAMFAEAVVRLRDLLAEAVVPDERTSERLEAGQPTITVMGVTGASSVRVTHALAERVLNTLGLFVGGARPAVIMEGAGVIPRAAHRPAATLASDDMVRLVRLASLLCRVGEFAAGDADVLSAGIRSEAAKLIVRYEDTAGTERHEVDRGLGAGARALPPLSPSEPASQSGSPAGLTRCPVELYGPTKPVCVLGKTFARLTPAEYNVLQTLVEAYPATLTKDEVTKMSGHNSALELMAKLKKKHPLFDAVISKPGKNGRGYCLIDPTSDSAHLST